jgi:hypothetical protein
MILLLAAVLGLAIGLLSGGSLKNMLQYPLKGLLLPILAWLLKAGAAYLLQPQQGAVLVCLVQYGLLFAFLAFNLRRPVWPIFVFLGTLSNFLVILLNGGRMPVSASLIGQLPQRLEQLQLNQIYAYCLLDKQTVLPFLGDILRIGPEGTPFGFASVGDLLLCAGIGILCVQLTRSSRPKEPQSKQSK